MAIADADVPRARVPLAQHVLDTYASEINKSASVWRAFGDGDLDYRAHPRSAAVGEIFRHELLSGRRFFGEFLGAAEPDAAAVVPPVRAAAAFVSRLEELARPRLAFLAAQDEGWWLGRVPFFDVERERIWIVWRRILHSAHHRTQLTVCLRLLDRPVPPVYGPTADVTWAGADPTRSVDAASRR
jgi:uncharacterized damage-inducible protein DinB